MNCEVDQLHANAHTYMYVVCTPVLVVVMLGWGIVRKIKWLKLASYYCI